VLNQDFKEFIQSLNDSKTRDSHLEGDCHVLNRNIFCLLPQKDLFNPQTCPVQLTISCQQIYNILQGYFKNI
jgi:hypothetical protein